MKAAVLEKLGKFSVKEVPTPKVKPGTVLLRVKACGICGSDLRTYRHGNERVKCPAIMGHEIAGEIVEVGKGVSKFKAGTRVAIGADIPCGECVWCRKGWSNNCLKHMAMGYQFAGAYAEYCLLEEQVVEHGPVFEIPKHLDYEVACLMEPLACCINGAERVGMEKGRSVLIIGAGPMGCLMAAYMKTLGASKIIIAEFSKKRFELAKKAVSADAFVLNSEENLAERVKEFTGGAGVDVAFVMCASAEMQEAALHLVGKRGAVNFFGGLPASAPKIQLHSNRLHYEEITVTGSHGSTPAQNRRALELLASGKIEVKGLVSKTVPLEGIVAAFESLEKQEAQKIVVVP